MEVSKSTFDSLLECIDDAFVNNDHEFELLLLSNRLTKDGFNRIMTTLYKTKSFQLIETTSREQLDVRTINDELSTVRMSMVNKNSILEYCKSGSVNTADVSFVKKYTVPGKKPILLDDYHVRANLKVEESVDGTFKKQEYLQNLRGADKHFRYKKRYSFLHETKSHRVDLSIVRSSSRNAKSMLKSGVLNEPEHYEVEVEYLPIEHAKNLKKNDILKNMLQTVYFLCRLNANVSHLMPLSKKLAIVKEYATLIDSSITNKDARDLVSNPANYYLKYQPVTLMKRNLLSPDVDVVSVRENYCVTDKADGERFILYIGSDGKMYLINNLLDVFYTGMVHKTAKKSIIDGELIKRGKLNIEMNLFAAFDIYFINGKDVRSQKFMLSDSSGGGQASKNTRLTQLQELLSNDSLSSEKTRSQNPFRVAVKTFEASDDIFTSSKNVLDRLPTLSYNTDGLIYTPIDLAPGALYKDDKTMKPFGGSWSKVFKWKPPEDNSIDVLVKLGKVTMLEVEDGLMQRCVYVKMYVAFKGTLDETIDVEEVYKKVSKVVDKKKMITSLTGNDEYVHRFYDGTYLPIGSNDTLPRIGNSNEFINPDTIIEFSYNPSSKNEYMKWVPLRIRKDKTDLYIRNNRKIENTANNYLTVVNVWRTIIDPVDSTILEGTTPLDETLVKKDDNDAYYVRNTPRARSLLVPMLDFHNYWIKNMSLLNMFKGKNMKLLDIGCGQGGDIPKWIDVGFNTVVGIDNNKDNLLNSDHGIYKRYFDNVNSTDFNRGGGRRRIDPEKQRMLFLLMDGGEKWTSSYIEQIPSLQFKKLTQWAFGMNNKQKESNLLLKDLHNVMNDGFDVVSCQFAIHYFFESTDKLNAFCYNVDKMLLPNGYFVGTALDGNIVNNKFSNQDTSVLRGEVNGKVIWQMEKNYDHYSNKSVDDENLGKEIQVYVETINKRIPEYLVDFELLKRKLEVYDIRLVDFDNEDTIFSKYDRPTSSFDYLYTKMKDAFTKGKKHHAMQNAIDNMDDVMKEYSFMNRWFVFKKYT